MMRHAAVETATPAQPRHRKAGKRRVPRRMAARLRLLRRRARGWKRQARRAATLALIGSMTAQAPMSAYAQFGQAPMGQPQGLVNGAASRGLARLSEINGSGPGFMYYGINGADRGLGYIGSYMTLGGFIPYAQDDLGGFWSADLRGHLSVNGGFFSNVGVVRKQLLGNGSLLGVGVYWDYDGDLYQYAGEGNGPFGQFGHVYNQVGVSGEVLTDWGNIRSNGYMPVGTTAYTVGAPGSPFATNYIMCQYGLDAALGGADLEVGAYVPGLADFAGMISVGGYALGNTFNKWQTGSTEGLAIVPWFGGVYTRLDMTFANNWDFSLQYNNDSYFESTGFARLTYRIGGSRRRNVPDQLEQPMMRNEHIVRAHQTPLVATNGSNGNLPWNVIHVNNAAPSGGNGSAESPFNTIAAGNAAATRQWDIVLVDPGTGTAVGYDTAFNPLAANQYFIGNGSPFEINTVNCGIIDIATLSGVRPLLSNPTGESIIIKDGLYVNNFNIQNSRFGIVGEGNLSSPQRNSLVNNVSVLGQASPVNPNQTGIYIDNATGTAAFTNTLVQNMTSGGFVANGGDANINFQGTITSDVAQNGGIVNPVVLINGTTGGTINLAVGSAPATATVPNLISDTGGNGIQIVNSLSDVNIGNAQLTDTTPTAIDVVNSGGTITVSDSEIVKNTAGEAINVNGGSPTFVYAGKITNSAGNMLKVDGTTGGSVSLISPYGSPFSETGDGILVENSAGNTTVIGAEINSQQEGIYVHNTSGINTFNEITITGAVNAGVSLQDNSGTQNFDELNIATNGATGFLGLNNNIVNVTGNSSINTTAAPALRMVNSIATSAVVDMGFQSIASANSPTNGILLDNLAGVFSSNTVTVTDSLASGFVIRDSEGLAVDVPVITAVSAGNTPGAHGIEITDTNTTIPDAINFGTVNISTQQGAGLLTKNTGLVTTAGGTIDATGGAAISATDSELGITLTSVASTSSTGNGINLVRNDGTVEITQTTVTDASQVGINAVNNTPGFTADFGVTTVNQANAEGVNLVNTAEPNPDTVYRFSSLDITTSTTTGAAGFRTRNAGTVNFDSPANVSTDGGAAVDMENTTGTTNGVAGSGFTFNQLSSTNSAFNGVRLFNLNSDFRVLTTTSVTNAAGDSVLIGDNDAAPQEYQIRFNTIDINGRQDVGLQVNGIAGELIIDDLQIDNTAGIAGDAVRVEGTSDRGPTGGRTYIQSGVITGTQGNGVFVQNSILSLDSVTITGSTANAVFGYAAENDITTLSVVDSSLTATSIQGVRLEALGSALGRGEVNGTILRNQIDVTQESILGIAMNKFGDVFMNAQSNYGTLAPYAPAPGAGNITLDNGFGGFVGIFQNSAAELSTSNNNAGVTPIGVITTNVVVPTPPPPSP